MTERAIEKQEHSSYKLILARTVSRIAEPIIWIPLMIWLVLRNISLTGNQKLIYYPVLTLFVFVIPFSYFIYLVYVKKEFDIDITQRSKRVGFTLKSMVSFSVAVVITYFMNRELFIITAAVFLATFGLVLVTLRWKISFHGGLNSLIFCTVNYLYEWRFWWLFLLLVPIGWSRLVLGKHNLAQLIAGILLCTSIFLFVTGTL